MYARFIIGIGVFLVVAGATTAFNNIESIRENVVLPQFYQAAIDELFKAKAPQVVSSYLYDSQSGISFELMVESQIYLFWKFAAQNQDNSMYLTNLGYYIRDIRQDPRFNELRPETKQRLEAVADHLPPALQQLFLATTFCLQNNAYSEYIYGNNDNIDANRSRVLIWYEKNLVGAYGSNVNWSTYFATQQKSNSGYLDLKVALSVRNRFIFRETELVDYENSIFAWKSGEVVPTSLWTMDLVDRRFLVFSQNDYILCASPTLYNSKRRLVEAYNDGHTKDTLECQWIAKKCPYFAGQDKREFVDNE